MKRIFFCIALFFLFCFLFSANLIGFGLKWVVKSKTDCELAYCKLEWEEGQLVLYDVVLFDSAFHVHMEKAAFRFDWSSFPRKFRGHLTIDSPRLSISKTRDLPNWGSGWFECSLSVNNGVFDWDGPVHFSIAHNTSASSLSLNWKEGGAVLTMREKRVETVLDRFKLALLSPWIPYIQVQGGTISGRLAVSLEGKPISANLKLLEGNVAFPDGSGENLQATLSYNIGLGAKWDCKGFGKTKEVLFPFFCSGRGFFKNFWIESEVRFDESYCKILGDEMRVSLECESICASEVSWLQAAFAPFFPECNSFSLTSGQISGKAAFSGASWNAEFKGNQINIEKGEYRLSCQNISADLTQEGGSFILLDDSYELKFAGMWDDWNAEARLSEIELMLHGGWDGEKVLIEIEKGHLADLQFQGKGSVDTYLNASFLVEGNWEFLQKSIPFYCPIRAYQGKIWSFDFRGKRKTWDFLRLNLTYDGKEIAYLPTSHLLGQPLSFDPSPTEELKLSVQLPWTAILASESLLKEWGIDLKKCPQIETAELQIQYLKGDFDLKAKGDSPSFSFHAHHAFDEWTFQLESDLALTAQLKNGGWVKGVGKWKSAFETHFEGKIDRSLHCELSLSNTSLDLKTIDWLQFEGIASGGGHFIYNGQIDADFDFGLSSFVCFGQPLENESQIHLSYNSKQGALIQGLHLHGKFDCVIDLLEYDAKRDHWILHDAQIHIPAPLVTHKFLKFLDQERDLNFTADFDLASDFSTLSCTMHEGSIPYNGSYHHIDQLNLSWKKDKCEMAFRYREHLFGINWQIGDQIAGRLILGEEEMPLAIDWEYRDQLFIQSIEGSFNGIGASFHAESPNVLVGSAHFNFTALAPLLPREVAQVFEEIKMGRGYELKGRLQIQNNLPYFKGILSGKAIELFGFQFRTLLAQIDLAPRRLRIYDVKISDSAGMMKIDEILLKHESAWTIAIPELALFELRPSLLVRPGQTAGPLSPLVIRELKISDFKGVLDDGKTYTGKGKLHFINSYKREETVFDIPANVLSRIVGLDLDLLIPVTGDLTFEIKDGYFNLLELTNAYSEGKRSQFFLESNPLPRMDLEGNLQIFIKMKQFVLLKITESLIISIDGLLDNPQYHLKKKRFFGLM